MPNLVIDLGVSLDEFAELVAEKLQALQATEDGPKRDATDFSSKPNPKVNLQFIPGLDPRTAKPYDADKVFVDFPEQPEIDAVYNEVKRKARVEELVKRDIRALRKMIANVENKTTNDYMTLQKSELVGMIVDLESIIGRTCEEEIARVEAEAIPDDNDESEIEPDDDNDPGELTREQALGLELADLKRYALDHDVPAEDLRGLDIDAVVDLLFGADVPQEATQSLPEASEDSDEEELTEDEVRAMSIGELKELADEFEIKYDLSVTRTELIDKILELGEEDE